MLDIQSGPDVDSRIEKFLDILPALGVTTRLGIGMSELIDEDQIGMARERGVDIEIIQLHAAV